MPWETSDAYIRSEHRSPDEFQPNTLHTITLSEDEGIKAIIGKPNGKDTMGALSYALSPRRGEKCLKKRLGR